MWCKRPNSSRIGMRNAFWFALLFCFCATSLQAQNQTAKSTPAPSSIGYWEYLPPDYNSNTNNYPVVFFLHGLGERGTDLNLVLRNGPPKHVKNGYKFPFILISPQLKSNFGSWPASYIDNVIEYCRTYLRIDPSRIYLTGLSLGGGGVWGYAQDPNLVKKLAAIAVVCGSASNPSKACNLTATNLPVWAFHGDADNTVNMSKTVNMVNAINACVPAPNPLAIKTIYPGVGHNAWDNAYRTDHVLHNPNVYEWLMQFKNGGVNVNAGNDITLNLPTNAVNITGTASTEGGTITSYSWTRVTGPSSVTMANTSTPTLSLTNMAQGVYTFRLTCTDSQGETAYDEVKVTVISANVAPVANAGPDKTLTLPTNSLIINGTGTDSDGSIASYSWTKVSGPTATLTNASTANLSLSNLLQGTYIFSLTVTDNQGATGTDQVTVTVNPAAVNQNPVANAGVDKTVNLPTSTTTLTGTGSDPDGTITTYLWEIVSGPTATLTNANTASVSMSNLLAGVYVMQLTVTDNIGAKASDQATVTVIAANQAPVANAGVDQILTLPTSTTSFTGTGSDADGSISSYVWTQVSGAAATLSGANTTALTVSGLVAGNYIFRLTVTDDKGASSIDDVSLTVNAAPVNVPPTAQAGGDKTLNLPTNTVTLTGSGTDTDGFITTYLWEKISGPSFTAGGTNAASLVLSNLVDGVYIFRLTVTDNQGATGSDLATITVIAANQSPVANAGADKTISLPTSTVVLTGAGSDTDGSVASYEWTTVSGPGGEILTNNLTPTLTVTNLTEGTYIFQLTVTDNQGASDVDEVIVTVLAAPVNQLPIVNAGADRSITLPVNTITLNGTASDSDGSIATYGWTLISGPSATLVNANTATLTANDLLAGTYTFRLTATDNQSASASDDVIVTVLPMAVNQSPVANAGADVTLTLPQDQTILNGTGTDPDGTITAYLWEKVTGPVATLSGENTSTLQLTALVAGTYTFRLTVTDNQSATASDLVVVQVNVANTPPVANAGSDITLNLPTNTTNINGVGTDADGTIAAYSWTLVSGPSAPTLSQDNTATLTVADLIAGTYTFRLTVTDDDGDTGSDDVKVIVNAANQTPTAIAGNSQTITLPTATVVFAGGGTDPDGTIVSYAWVQTAGPSGVTLSNANTKDVTITVTTDGLYTFRLTVTDNAGASDYDDVTLTVNPAAVNQPPVADAGGNQSISLPVNTINLTGTGTDPDGSIAAYHWSKISGPAATLTNDNTATLTANALTEGTYIFRLTVTDNGGLTATDDVTVNVLPAIVNQAPTANAGADKTITLPTNSLTITGTGTDADGAIATYGWTQVSGASATLTNQNTTTLTVSGLAAGTYVFRLTVTDNGGATGSDDVTVTVNAAPVNQPPVANAGPAKTITLPINSVTLTGTGTDADGSVVQYTWSKVSGPAATLTNATTTTLTASNLVAGTYTFRLTVKDNGGLTASATTKVTVLPAIINQTPTANAGADQTITLPLNTVTLFGAGSDPDGTIVSYVWTQISGVTATLTNASTATLTVSDLGAGVSVFRLTVTDNGTATASDDVVLTVNTLPVNQPPVANAGPDQTVTLPTNTLNLTGTGSDNDGNIVRYTWVKASGPAATLGATNQPVLSLADLTEGSYIFRLEVEDNQGATASDDVQVTVMPATVNQAPVVSAGNDRTLFLPANSLTVDGSASDADGSIVSLAWTQVSGATATLSGVNNTSLAISDLTEGIYRFRLTATDDKGAVAFDDVQVTVNAATVNQPPVAAAGPDITVKLPANAATITGTGTDSDGTISSYLWLKTSGPTCTLSGDNTTTLDLTNLVEGVYTFSLTVTDNNGSIGVDAVTVTVLPAAINLPPDVNAGEDVTIELPLNTVTLQGTITDDGTYTPLWLQISGGTSTITGENTETLTVSDLTEGVYVYRLTAKDDGNLSNADEVRVTVTAAQVLPEPPVVDAGEDQIIQLPVNEATFMANASAPNTLIVSYKWVQTGGNVLNITNDTTAMLTLTNLLPGTYHFNITIVDSENKTASDAVTLTVLEEEPVARPQNLFSPDNKGDLSTETWNIENASLLNGCDIVVYNRQGQQVYASVGYPVPWDGTFNGKPLPDGAYFYIISCAGQKKQTGSVTIARLK